MPLSYTIKGIAPNGLDTYPDAVRLMFWSWVVDLGLKAKDRDLSQGLDAYGEPLRPISKQTRKHRISAMTPSGKGDPSAPPLSPGRKLSRVRSLLAGRALVDRAEFWWRYDPFTHNVFSIILTYQAEDQGRDVFGLSPEATEEVRMQALRRWRTWLTSGQVVPLELEGRQVVAPLAATGTEGPIPGAGEVYGHAPTPSAVFGIGPQPAAGAKIRGFSEKEFKAFYRQTMRANVQGRPGERYNRILRHIWGDQGPARPRGGVTVPKPPKPPPKPPKPVPVPVPTPSIEFVGTIPADVQKQFESHVNEIPEHVLKTLQADGQKFVYAEKLIDKYPGDAGVSPRGWPAGMTWEHADGQYNTSGNEIFVAQKRKDYYTGAYVDSGRQRGVLHHETGHALDAVLKYLSRGAAFKDAHAKDVASMSDADKSSVSYQLQAGDTGTSETWAELFANHVGSKSASSMIMHLFPECLKVLQTIIDSLK